MVEERKGRGEIEWRRERVEEGEWKRERVEVG